MEHTCNKEADIASIKVHVEYHSDLLNRIDTKIDKLASKRELNIHRALLSALGVALMSIITWMISGKNV